MPYRVYFSKKVVVESDKIIKIHECYKKHIEILEVKKDQHPLASADNHAKCDSEPSVIGNVIQSVPLAGFFVYLFTDQKFTLPKLTVYLDPPAKHLYDRYHFFITTAVLKQSEADKVQLPIVSSTLTTAKHIASKQIEHALVFFWELILRVVAIALSDNIDEQNDGHKLLEVLTGFMEDLRAEEVLGKKEDAYGLYQALSEDHPTWDALMDAEIKNIKKLGAKRKIMIEVLGLLEEAELHIKSYLLTFLTKGKGSSGAVTNACINVALDNTEKKLLSEGKFNFLDRIADMEWVPVLSNEQKRIIDTLKKTGITILVK